MTKNIYILALGLLITACSTKEFDVTDNGLQYKIHEAYGKRKPKTGDIMQMHIVYRNAKDSVIFDSKPMGDQFVLELLEPVFNAGLEEAFAMMGEGDSASFLISADSMYAKIFRKGLPSFLHPGDFLRFDVRLNKIMSAEEYAQLKSNEYDASQADEESQIKKYLTDNNMKVSPLPSGLIYIPFVEGNGKQAKKGDRVNVKYVGHFLNGGIFDSSNEAKGHFTFTIGDTTLIEGWNEGIAMMKVGGKSRLVVPSRLAYGSKGFGPVGPDTPLVFEIDLLRIDNN